MPMKNLNCTVSIFAMLLAFSISSCEKNECHGDTHIVAQTVLGKSNYPIISPPKTPIEVINNIKSAVALGLLEDSDVFRNDEKLWALFAGQQVYHTYPFKDKYNSLSLTNYPVTIDNSLNDKNIYAPRLSIGITKRTMHDHIYYEIGLFNAADMGLNFDAIEKIFGVDWKPHHDTQARTFEAFNPPRLPKMSPHGYQIINYTLSAPFFSNAKAVVEFDRAGNLENMKIAIERE